jgi:putative ABC transport system substrate-binding protein
MRRREFIAGLGGVAACPLALRAQPVERMRRIGVLMQMAESDRQGQLRVAAFRQSLEKLGWTDGRNTRIDYRWGDLDVQRMRKLATELVGLRPDVLFAGDTSTLAALRPETRSIPIVFAVVGDPIGGGFVASLARPGGNITGFVPVEPPLAGKWVQLLKSVVPGLRAGGFPVQSRSGALCRRVRPLRRGCRGSAYGAIDSGGGAGRYGRCSRLGGLCART